MKRKDLADLIEDAAEPIMEVLAQLYLFPNTEYENHWRKELYSHWYKVKLLKGNKKPEKEFMIQATLGVNRHLAPRILEAMKEKEYTLTPIDGYNLRDYLRICDVYFNWLCGELSEHQLVLPTEVYHQLDKMGL